MYLITEGDASALNCTSEVEVRIDGTNTTYTISRAASEGMDAAIRVLGGRTRSYFSGDGYVIVRLYLNDVDESDYYLYDLRTYTGGEVSFRHTFRVPLEHGDAVKVTIESSDSADSSVTCKAFVFDCGQWTDSSGRIDVGRWLGTAAATPTTAGVPEVDVTYWGGSAANKSASNYPQVDVYSVSDGTPISKADINAEVDTALNTAIPGSPTANSINERIAAIDDLTQASGAGDLAAILTDTATTIPGTITTAQNDLDVITGTSGVLIDDDAITSSKYDESTAFPVKSADTGSTQIARVGADSDTLETLSDQIDLLADAVTEPVLNTTVGATVTDATSFNLTNGVGNDDAYIDATICVMDNSNSGLAEWRTVIDYTGATKTVVLDRALSFTPQASTDEVIIRGKTRNNAVAGGSANTYTVTDDGTAQGNAVPDVHVWVTIDSAGNTIVADGQTDSNGQCVFYLDAGKTYYIWKHKAGYTFEAQPETVTAA